MHCWGDKWFKKNGKDLYAAIDFIETRLRKHGIGICGKEKYGTWRDEFLRFWDGGLYTILFGYSCYIGTWKFHKYPKIRNIVDKIHQFIYYRMDLKHPNSIWKGFQYYNYKIGLTKLIHKYQAYQYNKTLQLACKKWPNVTEELIVMTEGYKMVKPCKWGNVDGEKIHNKYWVTTN